MKFKSRYVAELMVYWAECTKTDSSCRTRTAALTSLTAPEVPRRAYAVPLAARCLPSSCPGPETRQWLRPAHETADEWHRRFDKPDAGRGRPVPRCRARLLTGTGADPVPGVSGACLAETNQRPRSMPGARQRRREVSGSLRGPAAPRPSAGRAATQPPSRVGRAPAWAVQFHSPARVRNPIAAASIRVPRFPRLRRSPGGGKPTPVQECLQGYSSSPGPRAYR